MTSPEHDDVFRAYHRIGDRQVVVRGIVTGFIALAVVAAVAVLGAANVPVAAPAAVAETVAPSASATPSPIATTGSGPRDWSITIDTVGYQKEIDQCLWVRMDLGLSAPLVGAHNYCGGSVVLEMAIGDTVTLAGTGLDGLYRVSAERLAWAGDSAVAATAGLDAVVILQTCFWVDDGSERLLALVPA